MENLSKRQKVILIIIAILMLLVIGYYFMQNKGQYDNYNIDEMVQNNEGGRSSNQNEDKKIIIHITGSVTEGGIVSVAERLKNC